MRSIYLIGFMGAGKSSVGPLLAEALDLPFLDLDELVVAAAGCGIAEIFASQGEAVFRVLEERALRQVQGPALISLGGGAFLTDGIRSHIVETGVSVYLDWPLHVLLARVCGDPDRPLAADPESFAKLLQKRLPIYRTADLIWRSQPPYEERVDTVVTALTKELQGSTH